MFKWFFVIFDFIEVNLWKNIHYLLFLLKSSFLKTFYFIKRNLILRFSQSSTEYNSCQLKVNIHLGCLTSSENGPLPLMKFWRKFWTKPKTKKVWNGSDKEKINKLEVFMNTRKVEKDITKEIKLLLLI